MSMSKLVVHSIKELRHRGISNSPRPSLDPPPHFYTIPFVQFFPNVLLMMTNKYNDTKNIHGNSTLNK